MAVPRENYQVPHLAIPLPLAIVSDEGLVRGTEGVEGGVAGVEGGGEEGRKPWAMVWGGESERDVPWGICFGKEVNVDNEVVGVDTEVSTDQDLTRQDEDVIW